MTGWHWRKSCELNAALGGDPEQPLCARVYASPRSVRRTLFLIAMSVAFREWQHCKHIHGRWMNK